MTIAIECSCGVTFEFRIISIGTCTLKNGYTINNQCHCPMCDKLYKLETKCIEYENKNEKTSK